MDRETKLCRMKLTLGEVEACPEGACPFWETGGALIDDGCGLERLGLDLERPDLAAYLLDLRAKLEQARSVREREEAQRAFAELVPPDFADC
jgi:hypothetical protein